MTGMKKKIVAVIMMLAIICPNAVVASARWTAFDSLGASISVSGNTATVIGQVSCSSAKSVTLITKFQRLEGTSWVTLDSWLDYGSTYARREEKITVITTRTYRVTVEASAYDGATTLEKGETYYRYN